ncbi:MAG: metallophosphoesterase [Pseudomonadota bacterium]|nr:metallophosphoesterase [Pseudomonadota bacterium]
MTTLLHLSDTHFGTEQAPVVEALVRLSRDLAPDLLVLSGDVTQRAYREQFAAARQFVDRLGVPRLVIPGNHDIPLFNGFARLLFPYGNFRRAFGEVLEPVHDSANLLVLCVKTTRRLRHIEGQVSAAQIERVAVRLRSARPGQLRVVVVHQPLHVEGDAEKKHLLRGHEAALQHWAEAGADVAIGGHIHLPYMRELTPTGAAGARIVVAQAGTAVSNRVRRGVPNSVNVIRHFAADAGQCVIDRWDYVAERGAFECIESRRFSLDRPRARQQPQAPAR